MADFFVSLGNVLVDRSPDELISAVIIALALSLAMAGLYCLGRRNLRENLMPMIVLMLVANLVSMAVGSGYMAHTIKKSGRVVHAARHGAPVGSEAMWADAIFRAADVNRDGRLSGEEASLAADHFVRQSDSSGQGSIDSQSLGHAIMIGESHVRDRSRAPGERHERASRGPFTHERAEPPADALADAIPPRPEPDTKDSISGTDPTPAPNEPAP